MSHPFDEQFLSLIKEQTETKWRTYQPLTFEEFLAQHKTSCIWQPNTQWSGLTEEEIVALEQRWSVRFPPDYRAFLSILHCLDRPVTIATYDGDTRKIIPCDAPLFQNWNRDSQTIEHAYQQINEDISYEVLQNNLWKPGWGRKPVTKYGQKQQIELLLANAPRLIPIYGHRFLLAEPMQAGNPILSFQRADIVMYAPDLYAFFCKDFSDILDLDQAELKKIAIESQRISQERYSFYKTIPFWGELITKIS
ncbi:SMI1/KNR4 family protein [Dictyobacter arantiisoli]|uniref:Knr4/Smi1-like domain-containing protein n=1 Tax=Dictyobacter arantiisoli TaxID=2014874 RepID=A0A5A5TJF4_9CHLR|nr:SMI1/KNR4 family protein [Dictyobacter arantiisoli]GCF11014.1 hypothetical protein KDI_45780 [Dictyobacter arantiisoli]